MADLGIDIVGLENCISQLTALPQRIVKHAFGKALAASAVPIVEALEARTPVDTGLLRSSIKSDITVSPEGKGGRLNVGFGKQGFRARMVEFGHRAVGHKPDKKDSGKVVSAHPFMRPATAASQEAATEAFKESLIKSLNDGEV